MDSGQLPLKPYPIVGFAHDVIVRPTIKWKDGQEYEEYLEEIKDWLAGRDDTKGYIDPDTKLPAVFKSGPRKGLKKPRWEHEELSLEWSKTPPMKRFLTTFKEPILSDEFVVALQMYRRAKHSAPTLSNFPKFGEITGTCRNHFGSLCEFLPLCKIPDPGQWAPTIESTYDIVKPGEDDDEE